MGASERMIWSLSRDNHKKNAFSCGLLVVAMCLTSAAKEKNRPADPHSPACKAYFVVSEQDAVTVSLPMVGLNGKQADWYRKHGGEFPTLCLVNADASGKRVVANDSNAFDSYLDSVVGSSPLYLIAWEEHRIVVPDDSGGHYAWSSNGVLSRWDHDKKDFLAVSPIHNTNRTIYSSSSVSLLKDGLKEIADRER
jgi:hypothetical protein